MLLKKRFDKACIIEMLFDSFLPHVFVKVTLPRTNMEVENISLQDHFPLQTGGFSLPC